MVLYQLLLSPIGCFRLLGKNNFISLLLIGFVELVTFGFDIKIPTQGYSKHPALYMNSVICGIGLAYMVYNSIFYRLESNLEAWPWASVETEGSLSTDVTSLSGKEEGSKDGREKAGDNAEGRKQGAISTEGSLSTDITSLRGKEEASKDSRENAGDNAEGRRQGAIADATGGIKGNTGADNSKGTKVCPFTGLEATMTCPICQTMVHKAVWHERDPWLSLRMEQGIITLDVDRHGRVSTVILAREHALRARKVAKKNRARPTRAFPLYARGPPPGYKHSRGWLLWWQKAPFKGYVPFSNGMVPEYSRPCPFDGPPLTDAQKQALIQEEEESRHAEANFLTAAISEMCVGCYAHNLCWNVGPRLFYTQVILSISLTLLLHALDDSFSTLGARVFLDGLSAYYAYSSLLLAFNCVASTRIFQQHYNKLPYKWPLKPWRGTWLWLANFGSSHPEHPPGIPAFLVPESMRKVALTPLQRKLQFVQRYLFHIVATYRVPPDYQPRPEIPPLPAQAPEAPRPPTSPALPSPLSGLLNVFGLGVEESKAQSMPSVEWINPDVLSTTRKASMASVVGMPLQAPRRSSIQTGQEDRRSSTSKIPPATSPGRERPQSSIAQGPMQSSTTSGEGSSRRSTSSKITTPASPAEGRRRSSILRGEVQARRPSSTTSGEGADRRSTSSKITTPASPAEERRRSSILRGEVQARRPSSTTSGEGPDRRSSYFDIRPPVWHVPPRDPGTP